jgi:hypothetical protein
MLGLQAKLATPGARRQRATAVPAPGISAGSARGDAALECAIAGIAVPGLRCSAEIEATWMIAPWPMARIRQNSNAQKLIQRTGFQRLGISSESRQ